MDVEPEHAGVRRVRRRTPHAPLRRVRLGTYSFFNQGIDIFAARAYQVPNTPGVRMTDLLTVFLDAGAGRGGILNVINDTRGASTIANPDVPVTVVSYP